MTLLNLRGVPITDAQCQMRHQVRTRDLLNTTQWSLWRRRPMCCTCLPVLPIMTMAISYFCQYISPILDLSNELMGFGRIRMRVLSTDSKITMKMPDLISQRNGILPIPATERFLMLKSRIYTDRRWGATRQSFHKQRCSLSDKFAYAHIWTNTSRTSGRVLYPVQV